MKNNMKVIALPFIQVCLRFTIKRKRNIIRVE